MLAPIYYVFCLELEWARKASEAAGGEAGGAPPPLDAEEEAAAQAAVEADAFFCFTNLMAEVYLPHTHCTRCTHYFTYFAHSTHSAHFTHYIYSTHLAHSAYSTPDARPLLLEARPHRARNHRQDLGARDADTEEGSRARSVASGKG